MRDGNGAQGAGRGEQGAVGGAVGRLAARVYSREIGRRNRRYDAGAGVTKLDVPVISVGNLSVGGTGKTPMVAWIVRTLLEAGRSPCIAMRGYKKGKGQSDEELVYRRTLEGVPVVAQPDRLAGLRELFQTEAGRRVNVVVLDDGFQHRKIARDLDLVLVDSTSSPFEDALLPSGWLREPVESLKRAHGVVLTHAESVTPMRLEELELQVEAAHGRSPVARAAHAWDGMDVRMEGREVPRPVGWLKRKKALVVCAIGRPEPFVRQVEGAIGGPAAGKLVLRDHDPYKQDTREQIASEVGKAEADVIVTTEKDWAKLGSTQWAVPVVRPRLVMRIEQGAERLRDMVVDRGRHGGTEGAEVTERRRES
ncbi:MAG: tetraacyldisaccharide 4'-kinase [Phycisphaerales bacterium]|nr:tetraacyldisaccharide 4'-kinase [Phycisphaerales bacterium]